MQTTPIYVLDTAGAAERLGISERMLSEMRWRGQGPPWFKVGQLVRYSVYDLEAWVAQQTVVPSGRKSGSSSSSSA